MPFIPSSHLITFPSLPSIHHCTTKASFSSAHNAHHKERNTCNHNSPSPTPSASQPGRQHGLAASLFANLAGHVKLDSLYRVYTVLFLNSSLPCSALRHYSNPDMRPPTSQAKPSQAKCDINASSQAHAAKPTAICTDGPKLRPYNNRKSSERAIVLYSHPARRNHRCVVGLVIQ